MTKLTVEASPAEWDFQFSKPGCTFRLAESGEMFVVRESREVSREDGRVTGVLTVESCSAKR